MKKGGYITQQRIKEDHRDKVLTLLKDGPQRFSFLKKSTGFSSAGLTNILDELLDSKTITKTVQNKKLVYTLTKKGQKEFEGVFLLSDVLSEIKSRGGKYISGGVPLQKVKTLPLFWPTMVHMAVDKEIENVLKIIPKEFLLQLQWNLISFMVNNIKKNKIKLNETADGEVVIGIQITYTDLVRMINNTSFEKWKKLWKKEGGITTIWLQDSISSDKKPYLTKYKLKGEFTN